MDNVATGAQTFFEQIDCYFSGGLHKDMANILVVGGAGYIGSTCSVLLRDRGHNVWVLDDLSTGHRELVNAQDFFQGKAGDQTLVEKICSTIQIDCVMHFAAKAIVSESFVKRDAYIENNVTQTENLVSALMDAGIRRFVFSSTCAVYGHPEQLPVREEAPKRPISPYGESKLMAENVLERFARKGLQSVALRYFNACGAESKLRVGEWHEEETHLIPNILKSFKRDEPVRIFGNDYATHDGTCIRDYVHVEAISLAHISAMERLLAMPDQGVFEAFNLGSEKGNSVLEVMSACEKRVGEQISKEFVERRQGDPPELFADATKAKQVLSFSTRDYSLEKIVDSAFAWEEKLAELQPI